MSKDTRRKAGRRDSARRIAASPCASGRPKKAEKSLLPRRKPLFDRVVDLAQSPDMAPGPSLSAELKRLLMEIGAEPSQMTLGDLRHAVLKYLSEVIDCDSNDSFEVNSQSH